MNSRIFKLNCGENIFYLHRFSCVFQIERRNLLEIIEEKRLTKSFVRNYFIQEKSVDKTVSPFAILSNK